MVNVLFLDDNPDQLFRYVRVLRRLGCSVVETGDPIKALQILRCTYPPFDVMFTDFYMPKINGLLLLQQVKAAYPDLPVVLTSGMPNPNVEVQAMTHGAAFCMFEKHEEEDFRTILEKLFPDIWKPQL